MRACTSRTGAEPPALAGRQTTIRDFINGTQKQQLWSSRERSD